MLGIIGTIASLFIGQIPAITKSIADEKIALANSKTEQERVAAEERIKALEAQRDVLIAGSKSPWDAIARFALTAPVVIYLWLLLVWDKGVCKFVSPETQSSTICSTDPLSPWLSTIALTIIGFYFITKITDVLKR